MRLSLRKISSFRLISWCGNFAERHSFRGVSSELPKTMRKLWKLGKITAILRNVCYFYLKDERCFRYIGKRFIKQKNNILI